MAQSFTIRQRFRGWLLDHADEAILRWIFRSVVTVTIAVLAVDLASMQGWIIFPDPAVTPAEIQPGSPALNLPSLVPSILSPLLPSNDKRLAFTHGHHPEAHNYRPACARTGLATSRRPQVALQKI